MTPAQLIAAINEAAAQIDNTRIDTIVTDGELAGHTGKQADPADTNTVREKHVSNNDMKLNADHRASAHGLNIFGDGSDGAVVISSNTNLSADMNYTDFTINSGVTLYTKGYIISCTGTLTVNGTIDHSGNDAGSDGAKGAALADATLGGGGEGGYGGTPADGGDGVAGFGGPGAAGGIGRNSASGNGGAVTLALFPNILGVHGFWDSPGTYRGGGGGGAGGYGSSGSEVRGGGGGGGAGVLMIFAKIIIISSTGTIQANGGIGGDGGTASSQWGTGGGGGGGGGYIIMFYTTYTNNGSVVVNGGIGGTGHYGTETPHGLDGSVGSDGVISLNGV